MGIVANNISSPLISNEISQLIGQGFVTFFIRDRVYKDGYRVRLSYKGEYHYITHIDCMDRYENAIALLLSNLLNQSLNITSTDNLSLLRKQLLEQHKLVFRISNYRSKTQMIVLTKLIEKRNSSANMLAW